MFAPSSIMLTRAKRDGGTASCWQVAWNDPSKEKLQSKISLRTTCAACIKCMVQATIRAGPKSPSTANVLSDQKVRKAMCV